MINSGCNSPVQYDTEDRIPAGSVQRAGDNLLAVVRSVVNSEQLTAPGPMVDNILHSL